MKIKAYIRKNGKVGIRNHILILPISICPSTIALKINQLVNGTVAVYHQHVICEVGEDQEQTLRTLINFAVNPNVGGVLLIGLGNEGIFLDKLPQEIAKSGKPVELITIKQCGGSIPTVARGVEIASSLVQKVSQLQREDAELSEIIIGLKCGGTDSTSGIAANPAVGIASDRIIADGGTSIMTETTEIIGAEHILAKKAVNKKVAQKLIDIVRKIEMEAFNLKVDLRGVNPTPGNIESGITTIEEKSLCAIYKGGEAPLEGVLDYACPPSSKGFYFMNGPGHDVDSLTGMLAGGAHLVLFTSGRGTPIGSAIAPIIKITGNSRTFDFMKDIIDINAGKIIDQGISIKEMGEEIFKEIIEVCNGKLTKSEILNHNEFGIYRIGPTF